MATPTPVTLYFTADPKIAGTASVPIPVGKFGSLTTAAGPDIKVLNFALALETLEAELYAEALMRLTTGGKDMFGNTITGLNVSGADVTYLSTFATVEAEHRNFLASALGGNWVTSAGALFDFGFADTNNLGTPALTRLQTVQLVYAAEQTGVSAYLGAITNGLTIGPSAPYLGIAASILGTEARHTTAVAILLNSPLFNESPKLATAPLAYPVKDTGTGGGTGLDTALAPDVILYGNATGTSGGTVAADTTVSGTGKINPISGPKGFVFLPPAAA